MQHSLLQCYDGQVRLSDREILWDRGISYSIRTPSIANYYMLELTQHGLKHQVVTVSSCCDTYSHRNDAYGVLHASTQQTIHVILETELV